MAECKDKLPNQNISQKEGCEASTTGTLHDVTTDGQDRNNPNTPNWAEENCQVDVELQKVGYRTQSDVNQNVKNNEFESNQAAALIREGINATTSMQGENETNHSLFDRRSEIFLDQNVYGGRKQPSVTTSYIQPGKSYSMVAKRNLNPPVYQPPMPPQPTMVDFYLLILGNNFVDQAYIHLGSVPQPLFRDQYERNLFKGTFTLLDTPEKLDLTYKYSCNINGHVFRVPEENIEVPGEDFQYCVEADTFPKHVKSKVQLDVFNFKGDQRYMWETVPRSVVFYLKWMLNHINPSTLFNTLTQIQHLNFNSLVMFCKEHLEELVNWILEQSLGTCVTDIQRLYLCIVLGHLCIHSDVLPFPRGEKTTEMCDRFLCILHNCNNFQPLIPNLKTLQNIAIILVENSSSPGWLTFAAHFYPYLDIQFILDKKHSKSLNYTYDTREYSKMVDMLLKKIKKIDSKDQKAHQDLLDLVTKVAPSLNDVLALIERSNMFFMNGDEQADCFAKFCRDKARNEGKQKSVNVRLNEFFNFPEKIRIRMHNFLFQTLNEYCSANDEFPDKDEKLFLRSIISEQCLNLNEILDLLMKLSKSKSRRRQMSVLDILSNERFEKDWHDIYFKEKVDICKTWVITRVIDNLHVSSFRESGSQPSDVDKIVQIYEAADVIMRCPLNISKRQLAESVITQVVGQLMKSGDVIPFLEALPSIENLIPAVRGCYKSHVKKILKKTQVVIKKSSILLKEYSNSSLAEELLSYILDIIEVPEIKDREINEDDFHEIIDWCDVWKVFLTSPGIGEKPRKKLTCKKICQKLETCIEEGAISIKFLEVVGRKREDVSVLCAVVLHESVKSECPIVDLQKQISDKIISLMQAVNVCSEKLKLLESTITYGMKISEEINSDEIFGSETFLKVLNGLKADWSERKINEFDEDQFWGPLRPLINQGEALQPLINSLSFTNVAKKCLRELGNQTEEEKENNEIVRDLNSLIAFLNDKAIENFRAQWTPVLEDPGLLNVETMKSLFGTLKDADRLDGELEILEKFFQRKFSPEFKIYTKDFVKYPDVSEQVQHVIAIRDIFGLVGLSNETALLQFQTIMNTGDELTPTSLHQSMEEVKQVFSSFSGEELDGVIKELSTSSKLVNFMEEIVDDDIRFLIDAVEEHFDQFVSESSVSDLIDVHGFLAHLIKRKNDENLDLQGFLCMLKESCVGHENIAAKIKQCSTNVNSLRGLYTSIANRGEMTKEVIRNCLNKGEYWVSQEDGKCETNMSYVPQGGGEENRRTYCLPDLHDLRSRAHLIVTSRKNAIKIPTKQSQENSEVIDFDNFIDQVNLLTEISNLLVQLRSSGYVKYRHFWTKMKTTDDLQAVRNMLLHDQENWENILKTARETFYFLNYYSSDQICKLRDILINKSSNDHDEVLSLIHFADRRITKQQLQRHQKLNEAYSNDNPEFILSSVGEALESIFGEAQNIIRSITSEEKNQLRSTLEARVTPGKILVASLEQDSSLMINVLLTLYEDTSNAFPEPYQIVFCSSKTNWDELYLLLQRCFARSKIEHHKSLFCIANVELLPNELQFKLVKAIKEKQKYYESSEAIKEIIDYQLALICCGGDHHHIVEQFSQYTHRIAGMSDHSLGHRLKSGWPDVKIITSTLPGLGKTEQIKRQALDKGMGVVTFSISGPFEPNKLIQRLKKLKLKRYHCLHLDIGEVSDLSLLNTFLFQLIVTGMVSAGNQFYHLPTTHIFIEIANTLKDKLRESLTVLKYFTQNRLEWQNYKNFLVSSKITSSVQVVCQYLDIFDRACINSKEVNFSGPKTSKPLPADRCRQLLATYFSSDVDVTFTTLHTFLKVLADQLLKFSKSAFFKLENLESMLGNESMDVRDNLFLALLEVSMDFASRAIKTSPSPDKRNLFEEESARALDRGIASTGASAEDMVKRVTGMIQWEHSNHLLVVFHGLNSQAITAVYRDKSLVPQNVEELLKSQGVRGNTELEDMEALSQEKLQEKLEKIACMKVVKKDNLFPGYALTPDNILKMILIILRVRANVPIIIMGETGCGKTSLIRYLANTCGTEFCTFNLHAGISEGEITEFIEKKEGHANDSKEKIWIFLDEINTCDHLGLINNMICHHSMLGRPISKKLVFLAACNPYKLRTEEHIKTSGLEGKNTTDEYSKLVYRVHPLPEAMIDYVWDYGSLSQKDERNYIQRMVMVKEFPSKYRGLLVDLLAGSQKFVRDAANNPFCVSLRDVQRCIHLINWFEKMRNLKETKDECFSKLEKYRLISQQYKKNPTIRSIVLALAHCYLSRLPTTELRKDYRESMMDVFSQNGTSMNCNENSDAFADIVRAEEEDYLNRMELPHGTAENAALRENVFVMLVCILNRIPIFVVGKPGCSKSLSIQLIRSNLRGRDSRDPLFRQLPQLYVVSYQGSESSTSEGIMKVFEKAQKYESHTKDGNILPVVLLDEVGLAENSKYNPLKVLHSLLEPGEGKLPDVAVVGISNWSLDAAKMNRAIHLSRPEPTKDDLYETGYSLHYADGKDSTNHLAKRVLQCLAEAYFEYQAQQSHANFHGLRDYYSLIKSLTGSSKFQQVNMSLQRNFGGLPDEVSNIQKIFLDKLETIMVSSDQDVIPVIKLIQANLEDPYARHLMLITSGDSALGILKQSLVNLEKERITIFGSQLEEDLSEDYNYRILSRIILCMERDCVLILKDLESIYGSLYDLLNQNYAVVGNRKNCRVALGAYSNPMCQVNDGFRCIVLMDEQNVYNSDPPFLNRFEKQVLRFSDVLTEEQKNVITELHLWVKKMSTVEGFESHFCERDMFIGFHEDTLPSLVLSHSSETDMEEMSKKCKEDLMWIASPDGVLRAQKCDRLKEARQEIQELSEKYFKKPLHQGFATFMEHVMNNYQKSSFFGSDEVGSKTVIMTFSNIYTDIRQCLGNRFKSQVERLSAYKSEKQLAERINAFWNAKYKKLLVLQCKPDSDAPHLLLARTIIEEKRNSYKQSSYETDTEGNKHVCIVMHVQRREIEDIPWQFSFLCGWRQVFLDVLEAPLVPLNKILGESVQQLLTSSIWPIRRFTQNDLLWCFTCIKYTQSQRPLDSVLHIAQNLFNSEKVSRAVEDLILQSISTNDHKPPDEDAQLKENWQVQVACDRQSLVNSSTLYCAMEQCVSRLVRKPLAKIVYFLEKENAWPPHLAGDFQHTRISALENLWCNFFIKNATLGISNLSEPRGAESYVLDTKRLDLSLPFIQVILRKIDSIKELFFKDCATVAENEENLDENDELTPIARQQQLERISKTIINLIPELTSISSNCHDLYLKDVLDIVTADFNETLSRSQRVSIAQATFSSEVEQHLPAEDMPQFCALLHIFVWDHREEILDSLRMIDCCRPFIGLNALSNITDDVLLSSEVTMVKINKTLPPQEQPSQELNGGNMTEEPQGTVETAKTETQEGHQAFIGLDFLPRLTDDMLYSPEVTDSTFQSSREVEYTKSEEDEFQKIRSATNETESIQDNVFNFQAEPKKDETEQNQTITVELDMKDKLRDFSEYEENDFEKIKNYESDEKDVSEEEIEDGNNSERFGDILVTVYCKEMFPSQQVVEQNGGFEMWMRNANLLLSSAFKISEQSPAFHYLRLCVDFARIIFTSIALPTSLCSLYTLNEIGLGLEPEYLDHEDSFQTITEKLIQPLEEEIGENKDKREALQKFSSLFYGRCIDTNVDTCCARPIIEQVLSLERPKLVMMMSPVVLRLLMVEEMQSPGIFIDLITNPSAIENCPCLQNINDVFEVRFSDGLINHDSYPAVMICDLIQSLLNFKEKFKIDDIVSSDSKVLMLAKSAAALISKPGGNCGLSVLSAVAFLRGFFTMLAHFVCGDPGVLQDQSPYAHMMREVNSILNDSQKSLQTFFMKQLNKKASLFDIGKWFSDSCTLLSIEEQWHNERSQDKAMFTTVLKYPEYAEATEAYWKMISNETSYMEEFLKKCENSPKYAFSLIGMLINMVYLQRAVRKLNIKDEELVDWVASKIDAFPKLFQQLLLGIVGRRDFDCPELQLSPESSVEDVEMALLVLHITSVIATGPQTENVIFYQYLTNSAILENVCALAHCKDEIRSVFKYQPCVHESARVTCSCGLRLAFKSNIDKNVCPDCHETLGDDTESASSPKTNAKRPLSCHGDTIPEWALCTKHMSPAVYRALHLIVYSAFYAGIALGTSTKKDLSRVLNTLHGTDPGRNPANICFETIKTDLCVFMKILSCKKDIAIEAIHVMVEKSSDLMTSETSHGANDCLTPTMCQEWEDKFFQRVEKVVLKSYRASKGTEKMIEIQQTEDSKAMECRILERDKYPELAKEQNRQLKRLFRVTKQPCFEDFRSAFLHSPQEVQTKHSFFTLFFAKFEQFLIIGDLNHLLKWSRLVSKALTHRISRKDAQSKSIDDFIGGHLLETAQTQQQTESLQELFNNFKKAWNKMRDRVNQAHGGKTEMPRLSETKCVAYCLMDGDYGIYLKTAIEILVSYQNSIMDTVISFSLHQHPGLSFLERENCSGVMSASIQDVKEKEIINFQWSDDFFQDAQNNLEYGKGREITYDFERMEMVIAKEIVFGKCFLTGTLNKFVFAKELFHSCGPLLSEIRSQVAQEQSLPDDVRKGLSNLKERRIKEAQDLLQHIEVLIFLLKRELKKINVDMTLEEFAENWSPMLPSPFPAKLLPEPRRLIKIRHLAALYEALEDVLADGAIEGLADKFRKKLPDEIEESVSTMVGKDIEQLKPPNFLKALRRFIFRYLSSETEKYWPEERKSLQSCLEEPSLWFPLQPPHLNDIPREITLKYIHSIVKYLDEKEKVGESKKESLRVSSVQQKTTKQSGGRRRLKNFSRA